MAWWEIVGWVGSGVLVISLLQTVIWRLRLINLAGCFVLIAYNAVVGVWPMVGLNVVLAAINIFYLVRMASTRHSPAHYEVVQVGTDEPYLAHVLQRHREDIAHFNPTLDLDATLVAESTEAHLVLRGDETIGVVLASIEHDTAHILLDYVTPPYRDLSPGEFVFGPRGVFAGRGLGKIVTSPALATPYYERLGFTAEGNSFTLALPRT